MVGRGGGVEQVVEVVAEGTCVVVRLSCVLLLCCASKKKRMDFKGFGVFLRCFFDFI